MITISQETKNASKVKADKIWSDSVVITDEVLAEEVSGGALVIANTVDISKVAGGATVIYEDGDVYETPAGNVFNGINAHIDIISEATPHRETVQDVLETVKRRFLD